METHLDDVLHTADVVKRFVSHASIYLNTIIIGSCCTLVHAVIKINSTCGSSTHHAMHVKSGYRVDLAHARSLVSIRFANLLH